jgi:ABC-type transport system substrate-binding protein
MKKSSFFLLLLAVFFVWTAGSVAAAPTGKVTAAFTGQPSTFDPHKITGLPIAFQYPNVFDTLLFRSPEGTNPPSGGVVEAGEPDCMGVQAAQGGQVHQWRDNGRACGEIQHRAHHCPWDEDPSDQLLPERRPG